MPTHERAAHTFGPLHDLLFKHFPMFPAEKGKGKLSVKNFCQKLGVSHETVYKLIREETMMTVVIAHKILLLSRETEGALPLRWADLLEYVLPDYAELNEVPPEADDTEDLLS